MHTDDTNLQVITWTTKQHFFLCDGSFLGRHFLLLSLERKGRGEMSRERLRIRRRWTTIQADLQPPSIYHIISHELCKKRKKSGKLSHFGVLTAVIHKCKYGSGRDMS